MPQRLLRIPGGDGIDLLVRHVGRDLRHQVSEPRAAPMPLLPQFEMRLRVPLGLTVQDTTETLSSEQLGRLDQQAVAVLGVPPQTVLANPVFATLGATQANRVVFLGDEASPVAGALGFSSPLSLPYALDQVTPELARVYAVP